MAISVWTNSQTTPYKQVTLTTRSVVNYTIADVIESKSITKTPYTVNVANIGTTQVTNIFAQPVVQNTSFSVVNYTDADIIESKSITKTPYTVNIANVGTTQVTNILAQPAVKNTTVSVVNYTSTDIIESVSITKTPFRTTTPMIVSTTTSGANSGSDVVITEYADEYWITQ